MNIRRFFKSKGCEREENMSIKRKAVFTVIFWSYFGYFQYARALPPFFTAVEWSSSGDIGALAPDTRQIMTIRGDGSVIATVKLDSDLAGIALSVDGQKLAYATSANGLFASRNDGTNKIQLDSHQCLNMRWNASGDKLFYLAVEASPSDPLKGQITAYIINADGSNKKGIYSRTYDNSGR